jgi:hypothetical protein
MRLPPHRYPGYYSLRQMLVERFFADRATGAVVRVVTGVKHRGPAEKAHPGPKVGRT